MKKNYFLLVVFILLAQLTGAQSPVNAKGVKGVTVAGSTLQELANSLLTVTGVFVDANGNIYAVDAGHERVQKFFPGASSAITVAGGYGGHRLGRASNQLQTPNDVFVDGAGNVIVTGKFSSTTDFDPGPGVTSLTPSSADLYVAKFDPAGNFIWAKEIGGQNSDDSYGVTSDANGNVYVAGSFNGAIDVDPGPGVTTLNSVSGWDIIVVKLNSSGNFIWGKIYGAGGDDRMGSMVVPPSGLDRDGEVSCVQSWNR